MESQKTGNNTMKNATRYWCWPCLLQVCSTDVYCSKQPAAVALKRENYHPSFLRFWNWAEETVDAAKICGGAENVVGAGNPANIRKWIARFYYLGIYTPAGSACVLLIDCMSCPSIWVTSRSPSLIYFWVPSSCFYSDQPSGG